MQTTRRNNFLVWWQSFMAFTGYLTAAGVLTNIVDPKWSALALAINGGLAQATGVWIAKATPMVEAQDSLNGP